MEVECIAAVKAMYRADIELGVDPLSPSLVVELGPPPVPPVPLRIDPPEWSELFVPPSAPEPSADNGDADNGEPAAATPR